MAGTTATIPTTTPDPKMGGPEVLKAAIKRVQKRGKKVMLYANGQLLDTASKFYKKHGAECTSLQPDGKPYADRYNKFKSTPDPTFARACFGSEVWYQRLYELGVQAQELGADGLIYDQFGIGGPGFCFNESHGHGKPNEAWAECRFQLTKRLTEALRDRKPDFVVMTEWVIDGLAEDFPYFHGCGNGFYPFIPTPQQKNFPELFLYTFPELIATQRNPNPMSTRNSTNHACLYGMRHETESRYVADVKYLGGTLPVPEDYADCNSPPKVHEVCSTPLEPAAKYLRDVIAMRDRFADFFKRGRFIDTEGFCFKGTDSVARGFLANDGRLGVVVWNYSDKPQTVSVSAERRKLLGVFVPGEPQPVEETRPVPAETVCFFMWDAKESYVPAGYELVWSDEFEESKLDAGKWTLRKDMGERADLALAGEERLDVVRVTDGELRLNAVQNKDRDDGKTPYTTCYSVTTFDKMHFRYGYLEMCAKVPYGQGSWPSFWMKASPGKISPPRFKDYMVEVDVFEVFSSPDTAVPNLHKWYSGGKKHTQSGCPNRYTFSDASNLCEEFHAYGFEWTPREMAMYIDGEKYCVYDLSVDFDKGGSMQGFHDPLYVIFNNHIFTEHSPWKPEDSEVDERSRFPMQYWIDWIRLYLEARSRIPVHGGVSSVARSGVLGLRVVLTSPPHATCFFFSTQPTVTDTQRRLNLMPTGCHSVWTSCLRRRMGAGFLVGLMILVAMCHGEDRVVSRTVDTDRFVPGVKLFVDRTYKLTEEAPDFLRGMEFIRCSIASTPRLVCTEPGMLYVLTPAVREGAASQTKALEAAGFKRHAMPEFQLFAGRDIERVVLYTKELEKGDKVRFGKWTVLLAPKMLLARPEVTRYETLYNGIVMASEPCERTDMSQYGRDPLPVPYLTDVPDVIPIDIGRQLFVDDFLIAETTLQRTWHKAVKDFRNPVMKPKTELEWGIKNGKPAMAAPFSGGVWYDGTDGLFKAWYCAGWFDGTGYAFSKDGIHWERPELKAESGTNRIVPRKGARDSCAFIMDPHAPPNGKRFKRLLWSRPQGGELFVSCNGTDWSEAVPTGQTGDRSTIFYNPFRRKWIYSLRSGWSGRARDYSESSDFLGGALFLDKVAWLRVDNLDPPDKHWLYAQPEQKPERGGDTPPILQLRCGCLRIAHARGVYRPSGAG